MRRGPETPETAARANDLLRVLNWRRISDALARGRWSAASPGVLLLQAAGVSLATWLVSRALRQPPGEALIPLLAGLGGWVLLMLLRSATWRGLRRRAEQTGGSLEPGTTADEARMLSRESEAYYQHRYDAELAGQSREELEAEHARLAALEPTAFPRLPDRSALKLAGATLVLASIAGANFVPARPDDPKPGGGDLARLATPSPVRVEPIRAAAEPRGPESAPAERTPVIEASMAPPLTLQKPLLPPAPEAQSEMQRARDFVREHYRREGTREVESILALYAPTVRFFDHGLVDQEFIRKDKMAYFKRWPQVTNTIVGEINLREAEPGLFTATLPLHFEVRDEQGAWIRGDVDARLELQRAGSQFSVVAEDGKVLRREKGGPTPVAITAPLATPADPFRGTWRSVKVNNTGSSEQTHTFTLVLAGNGGHMDREEKESLISPRTPANPLGNFWVPPLPPTVVRTGASFSYRLRSEVSVLGRSGQSIRLRVRAQRLAGWTPPGTTQAEWMNFLNRKDKLSAGDTDYTFLLGADGSLTPDVPKGMPMRRSSED